MNATIAKPATPVGEKKKDKRRPMRVDDKRTPDNTSNDSTCVTRPFARCCRIDRRSNCCWLLNNGRRLYNRRKCLSIGHRPTIG